MNISDLAARVVRGYARILRSLGEGLLIFAGMAGVAFAVVFPLWWLAVNRRELYTVLVAGACLAAAIALTLRRIRSENRESSRVSIVRFRVAWILARILLVAGVYGTGVLFLRSPVLGIPAALILVSAAGVWAFGRGERIDRRQ